jgi:hypothetical protein
MQGMKEKRARFKNFMDKKRKSDRGSFWISIWISISISNIVGEIFSLVSRE